MEERDLRRVVDRLRQDPRNQTTQLYLELAWKNHSLRTGHWYLKSLLANGEEARRTCGEILIEHCERFRKEHGRKAQILDFGCGPVSSLAHLVHEDIADVLGVDAIADEYAELLRRHGIESPVEQRRGIGEYLDEELSGSAFDVVHVRNALEHTQAPALTWLNLFGLTREGGVIVHSHAMREATAQGFKQLHRFDLFPRKQSLWIEDGAGVKFSLTDGMPLVPRWTGVGKAWFSGLYEREPGWPKGPFLRHTLQQMRTAFGRRSAWAFELERVIADLADQLVEGSRPLSIPIDADRA